jgi:2-phospho-L-lactate/phosphoenolpyruvate guanylyltransferase
LNDVYAIIPVREFKTTKIRLSQILTENEREQLTRALLIRVTTSLEKSRNIAGVIVVGTRVEEVYRAIGRISKFKIIAESTKNGGVNSAVSDGISLVENISSDSAVLIVPSDLPFISDKSVESAINLLSSYDLVINPSRKKNGTNLLAFPLSKRIRLWYDNDSYRSHLNEALKHNLKSLSIDWQEFSFDVDDPEDLENLRTKMTADSFDSLIKRLNVS